MVFWLASSYLLTARIKLPRLGQLYSRKFAIVASLVGSFFLFIHRVGLRYRIVLSFLVLLTRIFLIFIVVAGVVDVTFPNAISVAG